MSHPASTTSRAPTTRTLYEGMAGPRGSGRPVAVHAENDDADGDASTGAERARLSSTRGRSSPSSRRSRARSRLRARTPAARLHIVHVSARAWRRAGHRGAARGVNVTCETCPHYLALTPDDVEALGPVAKCAPPVRDARRPRAAVASASADVRTSSPPTTRRSPPELKRARLARRGAGSAGCQSTLELLLTAGHHERGAGAGGGRAAHVDAAPPSVSGSRARAGSRSAPTPTWRSSTSTRVHAARRRTSATGTDLALDRPRAAGGWSARCCAAPTRHRAPAAS